MEPSALGYYFVGDVFDAPAVCVDDLGLNWVAVPDLE
jgi:hypothetical protein